MRSLTFWDIPSALFKLLLSVIIADGIRMSEVESQVQDQCYVVAF